MVEGCHAPHTAAPWQLVWQVRTDKKTLPGATLDDDHVLEGMQAPAVVFGSRLATRSASMV
jgi:hypothetical protein